MGNRSLPKEKRNVKRMVGHRSLKLKPDPEIIPTIEERKFFRGLFKQFLSKSLFPYE